MVVKKSIDGNEMMISDAKRGEIMAEKLYEYTNVTSVDHGMELYKGKELEERKRLRQEIIDTFHKLY